MDKVLKYQKILKTVLRAYAADDIHKAHKPDDMQIRLLFDNENNHYQVLYTGWRKGQQTFSVLFHFDIIGDKSGCKEIFPIMILLGTSKRLAYPNRILY